MVNRDDIGSWLGGPTDRVTDQGYPGERLGLPETGRDALARLGRRVPALLIDWFLAQLIAVGVFGHRPGQAGPSSFDPLIVFFVMNLLLVATAGATIGHRLLGLRVATVDRGHAGPVRALLRTALLCLVIPAVIWDKDNRGMHDRLAGTVLIRTR